MKKNLHLLQSLPGLTKQNRFRNLLFVISCFAALPGFSQNPLLLKSPIPGASGRSIEKIVSTSSGKTFFNTIDNNNHFSSLWGLWTTDGTQAGTVKLALTYPGYITTEATLLTPLGNNKIVFAGDNESGYGEIWATDGTQAGTIALERFNHGNSGPTVTNICSLGSIDIYSAIIDNTHLQLRKTDGTAAGTAMVYDFGLYTDYSVSYFKTIGNLVYFELNNNATTHNEVWRTDGTAAGTFQVKDLGQDYGFASDFMEFGSNIYFITISSTYGDYIWKSDGTTAGTTQLKQISATVNFDNVSPSYANTSTSLYFTANDGVIGKELWKTDGSAGGTGVAADINAGTNSSNPTSLTTFNNNIYFAAFSSFGTELYKFDGAIASLVRDINPGFASSNPANISVQNNTLLFSATRSDAAGNEFWMTDGSSANTLQIADLNLPDSKSSNPSLIAVSGASAYFTALNDVDKDGTDDPGIYKYTVPQRLWTGSVNNDGSNIDNWFPQGTPVSGDNVLFPANPLNNYANPFLFCNDLINNGSTIDVNNGLCLISGTFYNAGTINNASGGGVFGIVSDNTGVTRNIASPGFYNGQLTLSSGVNVRLTSPIKVNILRVEGADTIYLGSNSLQIDIFGLFLPRIVTDSSGRFLAQVGASPIIFPVMADAASYTPVTITNSGTLDYFAVNVKNGVLKSGTTGDTVKSQVVNKTWNIFEALGGGSNATITAQWNAADELTGFNRNNVYLNHYENGTWDSGTPGSASGAGPYTFSRTGITSFSPFSISSSASVLPVSLILLTASRFNHTINLQWQTTSQKNVSFYVVERSKDGNIFSAIGKVAELSGSTNNNYAYTDNQPLANIDFYRIKVIDADGKFTYSKIISLKNNSNSYSLKLFPNPAKDILNIELSDQNDFVTLQIFDASGKKLKEEKIIINENSCSINIRDLPKGLYNVFLKGKIINEHQKFVKQ